MKREQIEEKIFILNMKDRWSNEDYAEYRRLCQILKGLKEK